MENEMIERVAQAISNAKGMPYIGHIEPFRVAARVAIEAMREPTSAMLAQAVLSAVVGDPSAEDFAATGAVRERLPPTGHPDSRVVIAEIRRDYRAAIESALQG